MGYDSSLTAFPDNAADNFFAYCKFIVVKLGLSVACLLRLAARGGEASVACAIASATEHGARPAGRACSERSRRVETPLN